jgi:fructose-bisphosphate aldolase class I
MVKPGLLHPSSQELTSPKVVEEVATLTVQALLRTVPAAMPGIFFLSGEMPLSCDNEETATIHLSNMNKLFAGKLPWHLAFSYGKALQKTAIVTWASTKDDEKTQKALLARCHANSDAALGKYVPGTCSSVGTDGNIQQAAGPY